MRRPIFTPEHDDLRESFGRYLDKEIVRAYEGWEHEGRIPRDALRRAGELGFLGFGVPEAFGGPGVEDFRFNAVINEEAARRGLWKISDFYASLRVARKRVRDAEWLVDGRSPFTNANTPDEWRRAAP